MNTGRWRRHVHQQDQSRRSARARRLYRGIGLEIHRSAGDQLHRGRHVRFLRQCRRPRGVLVVAIRSGHKYLKTAADGELPDNLLALHECRSSASMGEAEAADRS